ncbi:Ribonuclease H-like protein [Cordyceps fumosorosea ARSEF 2679]|uniref:ribonuclease H n=1 Tax=Cordyceps fumosorosea (strain ARSEF 2679) TaxID=1081104 RepID=A0A162MUC8_CORFA|nr:Ribonuclease H-like protein [Cordyceps fumosorosea ARSEF 2679]OAA70599.1 Ribonuclease H-like protein [Cordyceps fumosorosea ARSEF 2679]
MQTASSLCRPYCTSRYLSRPIAHRTPASVYLSSCFPPASETTTRQRRALGTTTASRRHPPPLTFPPSMMNRKRAAPTSTLAAPSAASPAASKKRKTDNVQKFYAVQVGFRPGVYTTYAECAQQTAGFKGALFRSFISRSDAEAFAAGKKVATPSEGPAKFYAVAVGNPTGIFNEWDDAAEAIKGVKGPKYKRFNSRAEAVDYIREHGSMEAVMALGERPMATTASGTTIDIPTQVKKPTKTTRVPPPLAFPQVQEDLIRVYTDGSSLANGKAGARAGVGVFFAVGDARNISERLEGEPQTNQRAELMAMLRALQVCPVAKTVKIVSDSQYSINCVTQWAASWKKKGWLTATGEPVKNQDIIRAVLAKMEERGKAGGATQFEWVKGHAADRGNQAADALAVRGAKM